MAATVTIAGTVGLTTLTTADDATGFVGTSGAADTEVKIQGTASYFYQSGKSARTNCTFTPAAPVDMSAANIHLYWWMQCSVFTFSEPKLLGTTAPSGLCVRVESSVTDYVEWHVAGNDTWGGEWKCFPLDINNNNNNATTGDIYVSGGTLNLAAVTKITWFIDLSNSGNIRIVDNTNIDVVRYGIGLTAYGSDFGYADIEAIDQDTSNMYGIIQKIDGVYFIQGHIQIDDNAATTTFNSATETLAFRDVNVSSGLYKLDFTGSGNTTVIDTLSVLSSGTNDNTRPDFDASGTVGSFAMSGSIINRGGVVDFKAGESITTTKFNDCSQVDPSTATFNNNQFTNYAGTDSAMLWNATSNTHTITFTNCDRGVEITQTANQDFVGMSFDDSTGSPANYDVHLNNGGTNITIALDSSSNANSYISTGSPSATVTFSSSVTLIMTVKDESGTIISGAYAYIDDDNSSPFIMNTTTNVSGIASVNHTGGSVTGSTWRVRKYGYKPYLATVDIGSSDISLPVTLIADPQQT